MASSRGMASSRFPSAIESASMVSGATRSVVATGLAAASPALLDPLIVTPLLEILPGADRAGRGQGLPRE
jgi:hypothetical protein